MSEPTSAPPINNKPVAVLTAFQALKFAIYAYRFHLLYWAVFLHVLPWIGYIVYNNLIVSELNTKSLSIWFFYAAYALISVIKSVPRIF